MQCGSNTDEKNSQGFLDLFLSDRRVTGRMLKNSYSARRSKMKLDCWYKVLYLKCTIMLSHKKIVEVESRFHLRVKCNFIVHFLTDENESFFTFSYDTVVSKTTRLLYFRLWAMYSGVTVEARFAGHDSILG